MAETLHEIQLTYDKALIQAAAWAYFRRQVDLILVVPGTILMLPVYFILFREHSFFVGVAVTTEVFRLGSLSQVYGQNYWAALEAYHKLKDKFMVLRLSEVQISFSTDDSFSSFPYGTVEKLWKFKGFWLLFIQNRPSTLPLTHFTPEAQAFLLAKLRENNIPIT